MARAWMVIDANTPAKLAQAAAAGATHGLVQVFWDQCQTTSGGSVTATTVLQQIADVRSAGLLVCLRVSLQYIPTFVDTAAVKFRRNGTVDYNPGNVSGNNARDWVWSASTRALVDDFLTKLFNQITWSQIDRVQVGGGPAGELKYPDSDGTQWWGFSAPAQTGTDLASGQTVCPSPGYVPSTGTTWTATDTAWVNWYTQALVNWMLWLIAKHRAYFNGPIWVMHPGAGLRPVSQTPTSGTQALNYRVNVASGVNWDSQLAAYPDSNVWPYSTWVDSQHFWVPDPFSTTADGNAAPWYHLWRQANARGRASRIWGENTGGQTNADLDRIFVEGALSSPTNFEGLVWLNHDSLLAGGSAATYTYWGARIASIDAIPGALPYSRGVNTAGAEFAAAAATLPGTYSTDYSYDAAGAYTALSARRHRIIRLPFRWERIQSTRNTTLVAAELTRLQQAVADIGAAGCKAVLDVHNYARFINSTANGGATLVLGTDFTSSDLADLWTRLSTTFKTNANVYAYGLMNEPHDLTGTSGSFSGTVRYDWNAGTVAGWTGDTATASNVASKLRLSATATAGTYLFRKDDAATVAGGSTPTGPVLRFECTLVTNPGGTWTAKPQWQNASFAWQNPTSVTYTRVDTGATVTGLVAGVAVYVTATFSSITSPPTAFAIQVDGTGVTAGTVTVDVDNFAQGSITGGTTGAQVWEQAAQAIVTAIRGNGDNKLIMVSGYGWSGAQNWWANHPAPFITDPANNVRYEAHYYFDNDNSGTYGSSYTTETTNANNAGHISLAARAQVELSRFTAWLRYYGVRGYVGETGWPNTADQTSWNAVGDAVYALLDAHDVDATYWSAGARWGASYALSAYTGTNQDVSKTQATVIESHLTVASGIAVSSTSPALVGGSAINLQTQPFSPPAGSLLVACVHADPNRTITITNTVASLTWNTIFTSTTTTPGNTATAFYAVLNAGATNMSVTATGSVNNDFALKVYVITGADLAAPIGAFSSGGATPDTSKPLSKTLTPQVADSLGFIVAEDFTINDVGATSSTTTLWSGYDVSQNIAGGSGWRAMSAAGTTTAAFTVDVAGTQGAQWAWGVFEVRSAPVAAAVANKILTHGTARPRAVIW